MSEEFQYDIFLSHSSKDKRTVRRLAERLRDDGLRVWFDEWEVRPGDDILLKIEDGLQRSRTLALVMSRSAFGSEWVSLERSTDLFRDPTNAERRFIPLLIEDCAIPDTIRRYKYLDWRADPDQAYRGLLEACRPPEPAPATPREEPLLRADLEWIEGGHTDTVNCVAVLPDGQRAISASADKTLKLWDISTGRCIATFRGHTDWVWSVAVLPDGQRAISTSSDKTLKLWDVSTGRCIATSQGHTRWVWSVAILPDGERAISASDDNTLKLWDISTGDCITTFQGHTDRVWSVAILPDGERAISVSHDKTLKLWDISTGRCIATFKGHTNSVSSVAVLPDGQRAISASDDNTLKLWDISTGDCITTFQGHTDRVWSVAILPDGERAISVSHDKTLKLWDISTGDCIATFQGHTDSVLSVAVLPDGERAISASGDKTLKVWDISTGRCIPTLQGHTDPVFSLAVLPDGERAISASGDKTLKLWDISTGDCMATFEGHAGSVRSVAVLPDGQRAISASGDNTLKLWDISTGRYIATFRGHLDPVSSVAVLPDGRRAISASGDKTLKLWNVSTGHCIATFQGHTDWVWSVAVLPDGQRAISASGDKTLKLWDISTHRCIATLQGHLDSVWSVAVLPDGERAISASQDKTLKLWDVSTGRCIATFQGHTNSVWSVGILPDGQRAISASGDRTLKLWDVETGACVLTIEGPTRFLCAQPASDGARLVAGSPDAAVSVYRLTGVERAEEAAAAAAETQLRYTNAKVVLVGESGVGKSALGYRLSEDRWVTTESTHGMRVFPLELPRADRRPDMEREVWLWDFAGQPEYRLVHQLFLDQTALALVLFDPSDDRDPFGGIDDWLKALRVAVGRDPAKILVAARTDRGGATVTRARIDRFLKDKGFCHYAATSAKTGEGRDEVVKAAARHLPWEQMDWVSTPRLFRSLSDVIVWLKDEETVLIRTPELRQRLQMALPGEVFSEDELRTVVDLLAGQGLVKRLAFGDFVLLQPELLNNYAAAVVRAARKHVDGIGAISEQDVLEGRFDCEDMERLAPAEEAILLRAMVQSFLEQSLCIREDTPRGVQLIFPSQFNREIPEIPHHPSIMVTYRFSGPLSNIYATLAVRLYYSEILGKTVLWKDAAEFRTPEEKKVGFVMSRIGDGRGEIKAFFDPEVPDDTRVTFIKYIHEHLGKYAVDVEREREYVCPNPECGRAVENLDAVRERLSAGRQHITCVYCDKRIPLLDLIERRFGEDRFLKRVRELDEHAQIRLNNESLELLLTGQVQVIVAEADQIYKGYTRADHGIDGEIEFRDNRGRASGRKIYVQLKSGDSHLYRRKRDDQEVFRIKNARHIEYWQNQPCPVYLIVGTSDGVIRWMNVTDRLREREDKTSRQIIFDGEPFNADTLRALRDEHIPPPGRKK